MANLNVGTSGYSYREWKGAFYPAKLSATKMLHYYGQRFRTVEINSTFNAIPAPTTVQAWMRDVPADFTFALKAPQRITHFSRLRDAESLLRPLLDLTVELGARAGPVLFQLPPNFKKDLSRLADFLSLLPSTCRAAFEFRHRSWLEDDVLQTLSDRKAALCVSDEIDGLDVPFIATADWGYLRLRQCNYTASQLRQTFHHIDRQRWRETFVYFKHEDQATGPSLAMDLMTLANAAEPC